MDQNGACLDPKDSCAETDDDFIAFTTSSSTGTYSFTGVASGLQLYIWEFYYTPAGFLSDDDDFEFNALSEPVVTSGASNITLNFNMTCPNNAFNGTVGFCDNQTDVNTNFPVNEGFANMAVTMGAADLVADVFLHGYWPDTPDGDCSVAGVAGAYSQMDFCADFPSASHTITHEIAHGYQDLELLAGGSGSSACTGNSTWAGLEVEKCVTHEGFADFVAAAVWWAPSSPDPLFKGFKLEGDTNSGNSSVLQCVSNDDQPHRRRGNAARFFWDLYDSTTTGDDDKDDLTWTFSKTAGIWTDFPAGTANRQAQESGSNGRNVEDYIFYHVGLLSERQQNCLNAQVD
jgi:hypothetical protein